MVVNFPRSLYYKNKYSEVNRYEFVHFVIRFTKLVCRIIAQSAGTLFIPHTHYRNVTSHFVMIVRAVPIDSAVKIKH